MPKEFDTDLINPENAAAKIDEYLSDIEVGSVKFQAFSDILDRKQALNRKAKSQYVLGLLAQKLPIPEMFRYTLDNTLKAESELREAETECALTHHTISQKDSSVPGYIHALVYCDELFHVLDEHYIAISEITDPELRIITGRDKALDYASESKYEVSLSEQNLIGEAVLGIAGGGRLIDL